jgi:hypothetical protein
MEFNKTETIRNLKALGEVIEKKWIMISGDSNINPQLMNEVKNDLMFLRGLMDDIECDRITEFPLVEKTNFMTGEAYLEEPDRPRCCSPSTELFWTM